MRITTLIELIELGSFELFGLLRPIKCYSVGVCGSGAAVVGIDDSNYSAVGHDTEFLNVDDDEVAGADDEGMPSAEETRYLENSGWSSRTRAVAKYLQTLFDNEAERGRKVVPMDNLLAGKTRKEASRMFFEALVLKTRDYIHVEQENPFDNISIKPRVKLMKSDF
ncbi:unnamed protein product [Ilex paraguariensis]|uniref:Rad21/Rec8-like protein C-terminal eukaryotic domain-containing protein n=1 Tax=Ilex paraguariensis TaxID=185542 RepID=A0ABC8SYV6_9AQUA